LKGGIVDYQKLSVDVKAKLTQLSPYTSEIRALLEKIDARIANTYQDCSKYIARILTSMTTIESIANSEQEPMQSD